MAKIISASDLYNPYALSWGEELHFPSTRTIKEYGNRIYNRYPARSIALVPRSILAAQKGKNLNVLDPFMGSGTTAVETVLSGNVPFGAEMDPFARCISSVSSHTWTSEELEEIQRIFEVIAREWKNFEPLHIPQLTGIERWFEENVIIQLQQLHAAIERKSPAKFKQFFLVAFADCIKPCSKMERQSLKPYISTKYPKQSKPVADSFSHSYKVHYDATRDLSVASSCHNDIIWLSHDATSIPLGEYTIDIAITSPPYINALDYTRCIKVESALCGFMDDESAKKVRALQVGHETRRKQDIENTVAQLFEPYFLKISKADNVRAMTALAYFNDLYKNLKCVYDLLKKGGEYHMIIGDNIIRKVKIPTHEIIARLAQSVGFEWFGYYKYAIQDHRTSIPRDDSENKINYEHVVMLRK